MRLECPICGKEYDYESRICKECEDYAIYSQSTLKNTILGEKWNCAMFLDQSNYVFGRRSIDNIPHKTPVELFELKVGQAPFYNWNVGLKKKEENYADQHLLDYQTVEALKLDELLAFDKKLNLYLVYE
jgi:hypothetical protein